MHFLYESLHELNRQCSPSQWTHRTSPQEVVPLHVETLSKSTKLALATFSCESFSVSTSCNTKIELQIYSSARTQPPHQCPILVYFHGGYWQALGKNQSGFLANLLCVKNVLLISVDYNLCPSVSLTDIVQECRSSLAWIYKKFPQSKIFACGHSAGAHLASMLMLTPPQVWADDFHIPLQNISHRPLLNGVIAVSGIFDLIPVQMSQENQALHLSDDEVKSLSPIQCFDQMTEFHCKLLVVVAEFDSPEFIRQSREFYNLAAKFLHPKASFVFVHDEDHFSVIEKCVDPIYVLSTKINEMIFEQ
eukprot:Sdes_comp15741_c0_seq1m4780